MGGRARGTARRLRFRRTWEVTSADTEDILRTYAKGLVGSRRKVWWRRVRYDVATSIRRYPRLYLPIARRRRRGEPLTRETQFVIEGFPRSGNTFSVASFGASQISRVRLARHEHAPAQIIAAARQGIPALVLIRRPEEAVLSFAIQQPQLTVRQLLRAYLRFYRPLRPYLDQIVVATFDQVTTDFSAVIRRVNERYGTDFGLFEHTEENARRSLDEIKEHSKERWGDGLTAEMKRSSPSELREQVKEALRQRYQEPPLRRLRERADQEYETFARIAEGSALPDESGARRRPQTH
jgi:hypothetical protein